MALVTNILLLGATGYIGGSALTELTKRNNDKRYVLSALVRKPEQATKLETTGVHAILFKDLDDYDAIHQASKANDIVIGAADARHSQSAKACITGLSDRAKSTGKSTHYINTAGASMVSDWPVTGGRIDTSIHSDLDEDVFQVERSYTEPYSGVRDVNQLIVALGENLGVKTYIVPPPLIYGPGTGLFTKGVGQIHSYVELALKNGQAVTIGNSLGIWNRIHIDDLSELFYILTHAIIDGQPDLPSGKQGYYYAENGFQSWKSIAEEIGQVGKKSNVFTTEKVVSIGLKEAADLFYGGDLRRAESVLASNSRIKADRARKVLGWSPKRGEAEFLDQISEIFLEMAGKNS